MRRSNRLAAVVLTAAVMTAAACGTSGDKKASTKATDRTTTTADRSSNTTGPSGSGPSTSGSGTTAPSSQDELRARAANIVAGDFPSSWTSTPASTGTSKIFANCAPEIDLEAQTSANASSPDFARQVGTSQTQANSVTRILTSEAVAKAVVAKVANTTFVACVDKSIKSSGLKPGTATGALAPVTVSDLGDEAAGIDGKISGVDSGSGKKVTVGVSIVAIRKGDLVTVLTGASLGPTQPGDAVLFQKLAQAIADRQKS